MAQEAGANESQVTGKPLTANSKASGSSPTGHSSFCGISASGAAFQKEGQLSTDFLADIKDCTVVWIDTPVTDMQRQAGPLAATLGFDPSLVSVLLEARYTTYEDWEAELGLLFPAIKIEKFQVESLPVMILVRKNLVLTIHSTEIKRLETLVRYAGTFMKKISVDLPVEDKVTKILLRIIDRINERNFEHLRYLEEEGDELNRLLMDPETPRTRLGPEIYAMKHGLIDYLNIMWATRDVLQSLQYGDAEAITNDDRLLEHVGRLSQGVQGQIELAEHLSEVLASGLEVLQSIYNNQLQILNNRMAMVMTLLTIVGTAVLVPNTLATILGNSAFSMVRHDLWWYIPLLVGSTVLATWLAWWWVKSKGWLPKKVD
jgi:magnesium transporter